MSARVGYAEAAKLLGIPPVSLRSLVSRKLIPHYRISDRIVVFNVDELEAWLLERRVEAARPAIETRLKMLRPRRVRAENVAAGGSR